MRVKDSFVVLVAVVAAVGLASCTAPGGDDTTNTQIGNGQEDTMPAPIAVSLPTISNEITGPGVIFDSAPSHDATWNMNYYSYETKEYFISGMANEQPYTARMVVRKPSNDADFSGLVLAESMHGSGSAHVFEYTSAYTMASGHAAVEITTTSPDQFVALNAARYADIQIGEGQTNEILAQAGSLIKSGTGPMAGLTVRRMILAGTSMSAGTLSNYLPAHLMYRTPNMQHIYDGFLPTSNRGAVMEVDVPIIQLPTMHEMQANLTTRADSDEPGQQYRMYVFPGMGHIDSRDNVRLVPNPCVHALSQFPLQAYMSVGLAHLFRWVDEGVVPPHAERIPVEGEGDDASMVLDEHGNPIGGIRNPYVDVPTARYIPVNTPAQPLIANPSVYVQGQGEAGAALMCRLSAYQESFSTEELTEMYRDKETYVRMVEENLDAAETAGWSLPMYREMILADANAVSF
jgi:hypothetical protein